MDYLNIVRTYKKFRDDVGRKRTLEEIVPFIKGFEPDDLMRFMDTLVSLDDHDQLFRGSREELRSAVKKYMENELRMHDDEWAEHIYTGVLAFIHTMQYGEPYPLIQTSIEEPKKWWQFWRN